MTSFIRENIKKKPFYKRKWFIRITGGVCIGGVFGAAAAVGFSIAIPWHKKLLEPRKFTVLAGRSAQR